VRRDTGEENRGETLEARCPLACGEAVHQTNQEDDEEDEEEDAGDVDGISGDTAEAQQASDERENEEDECPAKHEQTPFVVGS
jgi:hypothetical protein